MAGVYGSVLDAFPELFRHVKTWKQDPQIGGSYGPAYEEQWTDVIIIEDNKGYGITRKDFGILDTMNTEVMYSLNELDGIEVGSFVEHPENGDVYRVIKELNFSRIMGHKAWEIERVQGNTSSIDSATDITEGSFA